MVDSELYEDAQSKVDLQSKSNTFSMPQDSQRGLKNYFKNYSKRHLSKKSDSSIYQDAQSKITNNSGIYTHKNSFSKISEGKKEIENKKDFFKIKNIYKSNHLKNNESEKYLKDNIKIEKEQENNEINNNINYYEEKKTESLYEEPNGAENDDSEKKTTIFEGVTKKGDCCNLPKCFLF